MRSTETRVIALQVLVAALVAEIATGTQQGGAFAEKLQKLCDAAIDGLTLTMNDDEAISVEDEMKEAAKADLASILALVITKKP